MTTITIIALLEPTPAQQEALDATLTAFAEASAEAVAVGRRAETMSNIVVHRLCYQRLRARYGLSANLVVRAIAYAARQLKDSAGENGATVRVEYDARTRSFSHDARLASLSTVRGRIKGIRLGLDTEERWRLQRGRLIRAVLSRPRPCRYVLSVSIVPRRAASLESLLAASDNAI